MKKLPVGFSLVAILAMVFSFQPSAEEQSESKDAKERHCLPMSHIDQIEIIDDRTLLFHMNGGKTYINHLPYKCSGLKSRGTFLHETSLPNYCDLDIITVVDTSLGMRLGSCPLGKFEPYVELDKKPAED